MTDRVADLDAARAAFLNLADAEGGHIPVYAQMCRVIADRPDLCSLLLEAPTGQRLPVILLAAIHDLVLRDPHLPLARWYPSVTGEDPPALDPTDALIETVAAHRDEIVELVRTRQIQTNEVNRCCAWWWAFGSIATDGMPLALLELGASAGLNLLLDRYAYSFSGDTGVDSAGGTLGGEVRTGAIESPVRLEAQVRGPGGPDLRTPRPEVVARVGVDQNPLDPTDPTDARWLAACTWPEQRERFERMRAATEIAAQDPPRVLEGDLVDDLEPAIEAVLDAAPPQVHVVVLSSWVLAYLPRDRRSELLEVLDSAVAPLLARGGRASLLTLEALNTVPWIDPPDIAPDEPAERRHSSLLAHTGFERSGPTFTPLALCQAHAMWIEPLG